MKVERKVEPKFEPVVLTLESQAEVDYLVRLLGAVTYSTDEACGFQSYSTYRELSEYASPIVNTEETPVIVSLKSKTKKREV